jgi:hypothetical protein
MKPRSPTLEGFRSMFRRPSLGFAEIAWRWSFGAAAGLLITLCCFEYLDTLTVTRGDLWLLRSRQPVLISQAIGNIARGSGFRLVEAFIVLALALTVGWLVIAALARAATVKALLALLRDQPDPCASSRLGPLMGLSFLRAAAALAAIVGCFAAFVLGGMASPPPGETTPDASLLVIIVIFALVWLAWSMVNWLLSLAAIFAVADGRDTFDAIVCTVDFVRRRSGRLFAVGTSFGLAHLTAFVAASIAAAFPLGLAAALPWRIVVAALTVITLFYFAIADFLHVGRLAAYVAILELLAEPSFQPIAVSVQPSGSVDRSELILSDVPAPG